MNLLSFDLNLLRVLSALLAEHSTTRAGEKIGLSQSAVSAALNRLRHALNDPLFVRQGQRLVPTDFARTLERPLEKILGDLQQALSGSDRFDPYQSDTSFKVSGSDFFATLLMPQLAEVFARKAPLMRIQQVDLVPESYVGILENAAIDLALIPKIAFPSWIGYQPLFRSRFVVIARKGHPQLGGNGLAPGSKVDMDLFCSLGHVLFSTEGNLHGLGDAALAKVGRSRRVVMSLPAFSGVTNAVAHSDLIALVAHQYADYVAELLGLDMFEAPMPVPEPELCMIWHERSTNNPAHRWLRQQVSQVLANF
ncbi:LysR family transcriptional regulator [Shimia gijangensis]|nr:LysR family transcriptional regulator [Shimia gijangensis]